MRGLERGAPGVRAHVCMGVRERACVLAHAHVCLCFSVFSVFKRKGCECVFRESIL